MQVKSLTYIITIFFLLCACNKSQTDSSEKGAPLIGSLEKNALEQIGGRWADYCDKNVTRSWKVELSRILDSIKYDIDQYTSHLPLDGKFHLEKLGPTFVRIPMWRTDYKIGWQEQEIGWSDAWQRYKKIKGTPIDVKWLNLNSTVRSLLMDDRDRAVKGKNYSLDKDSGPKIKSLLDKVNFCVNQISCYSVSFSQMDVDFIQSQPFYYYWFKQIQAAPENEVRDLLNKLLRELNRDIAEYSFIKNSNVRHEGTLLILPLDIGDFSGDENKMASFIESVWNSPVLSLKIEWGSSVVPNLFKILFDLNFGERAFVSRSKLSVNLPAGVVSKTIPHEIGHVLGFKDKYYTMWNPSKCNYRWQEDESDLMSNSTLGSVTNDEFAELQTQYPLK